VQEGVMRYDITSLIIKKKYGMTPAAPGFVGFLQPDEFPIKRP